MKRVLSCIAVAALLTAPLAAAESRRSYAVKSGSAPVLSELMKLYEEPTAYGGVQEVPNKLVPDFLLDVPIQDTVADPLARGPISRQVPATTFNEEGFHSDENASLFGFRIAPPDTEGDVGLDYYVSYNNIGFKILDKVTGAVVVPATPGNIFFAGFGGVCETDNAGDPIVLFDHVAEQWVFSQFTSASNPDGHQCFAISVGSDPAGPYHLYDFLVSPAEFNDYEKIGVWTDGSGQSAYHMTSNQFSLPSFNFAGVQFTAFERDKMLVGNPTAAMDVFSEPCCGAPTHFSVMPPHLEGPVPTAGTCGLYVQAIDILTWGGTGNDHYQFWEFCTDWSGGAGPTFTKGPRVTTADFDAELCGFSRDCVPQPAPGNLVDPQAHQTMYRFQNRVVGGTHEGVISHTVDIGGNVAGIRWAEFDLSGGLAGISIVDSGTQAIGDGVYRWMPSIAQDKAGNLAIGYSASSAGVFPSARYAGREAGDPAGTLQAEATCIDGTGVQTGINRWGDYSTMSVDPVDECTFWMHQEYVETTGSVDRNTRVCAFSFASCTGGGGGIPCGDIRRFQNRCLAKPKGNLLQGRILMKDTTHDGESVTFMVDGAPVVVTISGGKAQWNVRGAATGNHTVELTDPAGCFPLANVSCP